MSDPFSYQIRFERRRAGIWLLILAVFPAAISFLFSRAWDPRGQLVEARVLHFGNRATKYGDRPVVTVRLNNGSIRQIQTTWPALHNCQPGDRISLLQRGTALNVGVRACAHGS